MIDQLLVKNNPIDHVFIIKNLIFENQIYQFRSNCSDYEVMMTNRYFAKKKKKNQR